jgi:hypothetical protein
MFGFEIVHPLNLQHNMIDSVGNLAPISKQQSMNPLSNYTCHIHEALNPKLIEHSQLRRKKILAGQ